MISDYRFGKICVSGIWYHQDLLIINGEVLPDWWRKNGHHCTPADIKLLLQATPDTIILGRGSAGMMKPTVELTAALTEASITLIAEPTAEAVKTFNLLDGRGEKIAAGFHLTC